MLYKLSSEYDISNMEALAVCSHSKGKLSYVSHQINKILLEHWLCASHGAGLCGWGDEGGISVFEELTIKREIRKHYENVPNSLVEVRPDCKGPVALMKEFLSYGQ